MSSAVRQMAPVALLLVAVLGLFVAAESGQRRLEAVSKRIETSARRERALSEVLQLLTQAESSQRGYILLGDVAYLEPYHESAGRIPQALRELDDVFASAESPMKADIDQIERLSNAKVVEMGQTLDMFRQSGRSAAVDFVRSDIGRWAMAKISDLARKVQAEETASTLEASRSWRSDRWKSLIVTSGALAATVLLVLTLSRLFLNYLRSKEREAVDLAERQTELEQLVELRTEELSELSTHLQTVAEQERSALSRELHDELGGLLVVARMDVSWLEEHIASGDPEVRTHFKRVQEALQAGVDVKRRVIENLRPSLLDNLGLLPALRWQIADLCGRAGLNCTERYPPQEQRLSPDASIAIFRIVQEALVNIVKHAQAHNVEISIEPQDKWLIIRIKDDGVGLPPERLRALRSHGLAAMRHRASGFGGQLRVTRAPGQGTEIEARLPLDRIRASVAA
ncbi:MAG TPA: CHASE3 domain-containing protein [Steroidobacteraceae bacterium]